MATKTIRRFADKIATDHEPGLSNSQLMLTNHDLKPVEPERRQWKAWNFVGFWIADSFNINTWMISSSMILAGLSWWQSWICVWIGYAVSGCFVTLTGRIGAMYHIPFPVVARSSFGIFGSLWPVLNRAVMACVWYGVQSWIGGECVRLMIKAIWPSFGNLPKTIHQAGIQNDGFFVGFIIFWVCSLPFLTVPPHKVRHLFTAKAYVVPVAGLSFFAWCIAEAHGLGPVVKQPATVSGSAWSWAMLSGIMSSIANFATLIVNDPDFSRFARKPSDALLPQLLTIPIGFGVCSFVGIIVSSSSAVIFPEREQIWNPLDILDAFLDRGGAGARAGVFLIAAAFVLAQLGTNIAANSISASTDATALLPRYINIRRGGYICAVVGICICPWVLASSSSNFTTYLSAYSVFLSSIAGVILCDYYLVRKGYLEVVELYTTRRDAPYWYSYGINWRAYAAYVAGILINVVGFAGAVGTSVPKGAEYIYNVNFFSGLIVSGLTYYLLNRFFKVPACSSKWHEVGEQIRNPSLVSGMPIYDEEYASGAVEQRGKEDTKVHETTLKRFETSGSY